MYIYTNECIEEKTTKLVELNWIQDNIYTTVQLEI